MNRAGEVLFETTMYTKGWNGKFNNAPMPEGVYTWVMTFAIGKGDETECKGEVTLLRKP